MGAARNATQHDAYVTLNYHALEKGMSLRQPRPSFGRRRATWLIRLLRSSNARHGWTHASSVAWKVLQSYRDTHQAGGQNEELDRFLDDTSPQTILRNEHCGGTRTLSREEVHADCLVDLDQFFYSRSSVRNFADEPVPVETIESAVRMALKTPSVCNRQPWRVRLLTSKRDINRALSLQRGNAGFGSLVNKLAVVSCDLRAFVTSGERNQAWVDGGMFSMSLVYALHSQGVGTCCLNWSVDPTRDARFRKQNRIPDNEAVVMLVAIGSLPQTFRVACSERLPLSDVLEVR